VVLLMNTNSRLDGPPSRGAQLGAAIDHLVEDSAVADLVDPDRLAVAGHSMGGGGTLEAALAHPDLDAAIALQPWHTDKTWGGVSVPTLVIGAENDTTAPVADHAEPMYESLSSATERAYVELRGAGHRIATESDPTQARFFIAWLKRFVDNDSRYDQFLCPNPGTGTTISDLRDSCPTMVP
jgi:pimeloyl-ACP methyl ester carboxylesterase